MNVNPKFNSTWSRLNFRTILAPSLEWVELDEFYQWSWWNPSLLFPPSHLIWLWMSSLLSSQNHSVLSLCHIFDRRCPASELPSRMPRMWLTVFCAILEFSSSLQQLSCTSPPSSLPWYQLGLYPVGPRPSLSSTCLPILIKLRIFLQPTFSTYIPHINIQLSLRILSCEWILEIIWLMCPPAAWIPQDHPS